MEPQDSGAAEGSGDSTETSKKEVVDQKADTSSQLTKAEQEFDSYLSGLKIKVEDGSVRSMVERRGRDVAGKCIYLCYPCAASCSGEPILRAHISGKKHKKKLSLKNVWPMSVFDEHPLIQQEKGIGQTKTQATPTVLQKMADEVNLHNKDFSELDAKYNKYKDVRCTLQDQIDTLGLPLIGMEYLVEHPPEGLNSEPSYTCTLCPKQVPPKAVVDHMTSFWHRNHYVIRHFPKAASLLRPYRSQPKHVLGVDTVMHRFAQLIEDKYGRQKPINIVKKEYEEDKLSIRHWLFSGEHPAESPECTFEEIVAVDLKQHLKRSDENASKPVQYSTQERNRSREPKSPARESSPVRRLKSPSPSFRSHFAFQETPVKEFKSKKWNKRSPSTQTLRAPLRTPSVSPSDLSDDLDLRTGSRKRKRSRDHKSRVRESFTDRRLRSPSPSLRSKKLNKRGEQTNSGLKKKLVENLIQEAESLAIKKLAYHQQNPEAHPLYQAEWKKFWVKHWKKIKADGKDPAKHDFKSAWILFWSKRMIELHEEELHRIANEVYGKFDYTPPMARKLTERTRRSPDVVVDALKSRRERRRRSPSRRRRSPSSPRKSSKRRCPKSTRKCSDSKRKSKRRSPSLKRKLSRTRSRSSRRKNSEYVSDGGSISSSHSDVEIDKVLSLLPADNELCVAPPAPPAGPASTETVVAGLRLLVAVEDYLGSIGSKIMDLLTEALQMDKKKSNSSEDLLQRESAVVLIETAVEKLKGALEAGLVAGGATQALQAAISRATKMLYNAEIRKKDNQNIINSAISGVVTGDRAQIAQQMAAALAAQGKMDVSAEELAQLVDAVVKMSEAKKHEEAAMQNKNLLAIEASHLPLVSPVCVSSSLHPVESTYNEGQQRLDKDGVPDAMDVLSDTDIQALMKNFNDLPAEEQHTLLKYLEKLKLKAPARVERLRQYISFPKSNNDEDHPSQSTVTTMTIQMTKFSANN